MERDDKVFQSWWYSRGTSVLNFEEKILFHVSVLWTFSEGMFAPLFALFTDQIGGSVLTVSWAWAAYMIISGIGMIIVGKISDGIHKASLMFAGYAIITLATFSYLLISTPIHLL